MKTRISKILGVGLTIAMLASLMVAAVPASAGTLSWGAEKDPTDQIENIVVPNTNIIDIEASGDIVFAATDSTALPLYKSTDGGATWSSLVNTTSFPTGVSVKAIAIAPDDSDVVAIVTSSNTIEFSTNGGSSWTDLGTPGSMTAVNCVAISPGTTRDLAAGGTIAGPLASLYTIKLTMAETWTERYNGGTGIATTMTSINAVEFSPNYSTDKAVAVVSGNTTAAALEVWRNETGDQEWNGDIDYMPSDWDNGVQLYGPLSTSGSALTGGVLAAELVLPSSFLANDEGERLAYAGVAGGTGGGVIRATDTVVKDFQTWSGGDEGKIGSIAYNEAGKLVAGSYTENKVYQFLSPTDTTPKASRTNSLKQPGGASMTVVTYAGDSVLTGTSGTNSCVSMSSDDGYSFNDIGLIDTTLTAIDDVAVNADGSKIYLTTNDGTNTSVWLKASNWKRIMNIASATGVIIRLAPEDDAVVYLADQGTQNVWVSMNSGMETWKSVPCYKVSSSTGLKDMAVESAEVVYVLDTAAGSGVSKSTNSGASWGNTAEPTKSITGNMLVIAPNGDIIYGGTGGYVAYSTDGGSTFTRTGQIGSGNVWVQPDDDYADNGIVYVGYGTSVKRTTLSDTATGSGRGYDAADSNDTVTGMAQMGEVTYVLTSNGTDSRLYRSLKLETAGSTDLAEWSYVTASGETYNNTPQALKLSEADGVIKLWAVDTTSPDLESMTDPIATMGPTLNAPGNEVTVDVNSGTGRAYDITFIVERYSNSNVDELQLQIATDDTFNAIIYNTTFTGVSTDTVAWVIGPTGQSGLVAEFLPGETYYWRVRTGATGPMYSPWSESRSFTVGALDTFMVGSPAAGANDVVLTPTLTWSEYPDAIGYEVMLSEDPSFTIIEWSYNVDNPFYKVDEALKYSTTYYWRARGVTGEPYLVGSTWVTPAGPWVTGVFTTMGEPADAPEPTVVVEHDPAPAPEVVTVEVPAPAPVIPTYILWVIVVIGAILVIALIVLIVRTRRVA